MTTYNHTYFLGFAVSGSTESDGSDVTVRELKESLHKLLAELGDDYAEWMQAADGPTDSFVENEGEAEKRKDGPLTRLMDELEYLTGEIRTVIEHHMPSKGDVEEDCQRLCVLNSLSTLEHTINGIESADLESTE